MLTSSEPALIVLADMDTVKGKHTKYRGIVRAVSGLALYFGQKLLSIGQPSKTSVASWPALSAILFG